MADGSATGTFSASVEPDDAVVDGFSGLLVPDDGGLALVGDAQRRNLIFARAPVHLADNLGHFLRGALGGAPDGNGVVFAPAGLRHDLLVLVLPHNDLQWKALVGDSVSVLLDVSDTRRAQEGAEGLQCSSVLTLPSLSRAIVPSFLKAMQRVEVVPLSMASTYSLPVEE